MTGLNCYLEKYLDGSISPQELQEFRDLLASDPRLETELTATLELRSIIHDDLLAISVPDDLSFAVRENVGEMFARLTEDEEEEERRPIAAYGRSRRIGSLATAMVAMVMIALAPTINVPSGDGELAMLDNAVGGGMTATSEPAAPASKGEGGIDNAIDNGVDGRIASIADGTGRRADLHVRPGTARPTVAATLTADRTATGVAEGRERNNDASLADGGLSSGSVATTSADDAPGMAAPTAALTEENSLEPQIAAVDDRTAPATLLDDVASRNLTVRFNSMTSSTASDQMLDRFSNAGSFDLTIPSTLPNEAGLSLALNNPTPDVVKTPARTVSRSGDRQRISVGGTLVSGMTSKANTIALEGSAYLALSLNDKNKVGLEGGSTTFRTRKDVTVQVITYPTSTSAPLARRVTSADDARNDWRFGGSAIDNGPRGGATDPTGAGDMNAARDAQRILGGGEGYWDLSIGTQENATGQGRWNPDGADVRYDVHSLESETSLAYGLLFYDHAVSTSSKHLRLHGRLGIGGADGGLVVNARAYAAISTHENVAWTLGVGGSMLHDFAQEIDFNANYGLNAGVEFGF